MKRKFILMPILTAVLFLMFSNFAFSAEQTGQAAQMQPVTAGKGYEANQLIGREIINDQGDKLGKIQNLVINDQGQVTYVVLATSAMMGLSQKSYAVPWDKIQVSEDRQKISLNVQKNQLSSEFAAFEETKQESK